MQYWMFTHFLGSEPESQFPVAKLPFFWFIRHLHCEKWLLTTATNTIRLIYRIQISNLVRSLCLKMAERAQFAVSKFSIMCQRFTVNKDRQQHNWIRPAEIKTDPVKNIHFPLEVLPMKTFRHNDFLLAQKACFLNRVLRKRILSSLSAGKITPPFLSTSQALLKSQNIQKVSIHFQTDVHVYQPSVLAMIRKTFLFLFLTSEQNA